jgi:hypothetical protein
VSEEKKKLREILPPIGVFGGTEEEGGAEKRGSSRSHKVATPSTTPLFSPSFVAVKAAAPTTNITLQ